MNFLNVSDVKGKIVVRVEPYSYKSGNRNDDNERKCERNLDESLEITLNLDKRNEEPSDKTQGSSATVSTFSTYWMDCSQTVKCQIDSDRRKKIVVRNDVELEEEPKYSEAESHEIEELRTIEIAGNPNSVRPLNFYHRSVSPRLDRRSLSLSPERHYHVSPDYHSDRRFNPHTSLSED